MSVILMNKAILQLKTDWNQLWVQDLTLWGTDPLGGVDLWRGCFLVETCVKMKELGPIGGEQPLDPPLRTMI